MNRTQYLLVLYLLLLIPNVLVAQPDLQIWSYDLGVMQKGHGIVETADGGFVIAGCRELNREYDKDVLLFKIDKEGNREWELEVKRVASDDRAWGINLAEDGNILVISDHYLIGIRREWSLMKVSLDGELMWQKNYLTDNNGENGAGADIQKEADGGHTLMIINGFDRDPAHPKLIRLRQDSVFEWVADLSIFNEQVTVSAIARTRDGGYLNTGSGYGNGRQAYITKTDSVGNQEWSHFYDAPESEYGRGVLQTTDDAYFMTGMGSLEDERKDRAFIRKFDLDGNEIWTKHLELIGDNAIIGGHSAVTKDGGFIMIVSDAIHIVSFYKFDAEGEFLWKLTHEFAFDTGYAWWDVRSTTDGGAVAVGTGLGHRGTFVLKLAPEEDPTSVNDTIEPSIVNVYPNPNLGNLHIDIPMQSAAILQLWDMQGRLFYTGELKEKHTEIDINKLPKGLLLYNILFEDNSIQSGKILNH